jgi:hypothetical protein
VAKNKGKYKSQEPEAAAAVEPTEAVLGFWERLGEQLSPHKFKIFALVGALAVVLIGVSIYGWLDRRRESAATAEFQTVMETRNARISTGDEPPIPGEDPEAKVFKTAQERATATLAALEKIEKEYGSSDVAKQARLVKAGVLFDLGRYDDAATAYRGVAQSPPPGALKFVAREGLGLAIEAKALAEKDAAARLSGLEAALVEFKALQPDDKGFYRDVALWHQGRVLQLLGKKPEAVALYKELADKHPASPMVSGARERLALLEGDESK